MRNYSIAEVSEVKTVGIVGGTGYGALELLRFIQLHPELTVTKLFSHRQTGMEIQDEYGHLKELTDLSLQSLSVEEAESLDILFFATPKAVAKEWIPSLANKSMQIIDLSGDLRLSAADYEAWYNEEAAEEPLLEKAVYGLPEWNKQRISNAEIISNPGCFPTSTLLAIKPLKKLILKQNQNMVIVDGKTGVSGAGRTQNPLTHFSNTNENVQTYKTGSHQHQPEMERYASEMTGLNIHVQLTTHLIPMTRGLLCTIYIPLKEGVTIAEVRAAYMHDYQNEAFVRVLPEGVMPATKHVYGSNYCDIGFYLNEKTGWLTVCSAIDNLVKGASGQALQNLNIMNGWDETLGLTGYPLFP
ncbi:N-acetyl-gamma-glutamyl-phosphate reductase [Salisediminibacterium beveridgei]|nr:N-acetyl-gamma-glutamyl-phosphate reductase [Salisediminibacterium beveridgei]